MSKVTQKSLLELHGDYTTCGKAVQSYPPKLTQFGAFLFNATSWRRAARSRKVICTPVVTLRWIITSLFAGDADPTPKTRTERLFKLSLPLFGAQSPGGGTAHKQTRPVQLYRDQSIALERNCRFGNGLELSAEERLFKLSFPRALFEGGTLPINRLCWGMHRCWSETPVVLDVTMRLLPVWSSFFARRRGSCCQFVSTISGGSHQKAV